jgi:hypothetical protein
MVSVGTSMNPTNNPGNQGHHNGLTSLGNPLAGTSLNAMQLNLNPLAQGNANGHNPGSAAAAAAAAAQTETNTLLQLQLNGGGDLGGLGGGQGGLGGQLGGMGGLGNLGGGSGSGALAPLVADMTAQSALEGGWLWSDSLAPGSLTGQGGLSGPGCVTTGAVLGCDN